MRFWAAASAVALLMGSGAGCATGLFSGIVPSSSPREEYHDTLRGAGLDQTALGVDWARIGDDVLATAVTASLPFHETGYFPPGEPSAIAYRFEMRRGRRLAVDVTFHSADSGQLFVDLFRVAPGDPPRLVSSMPPGVQTLEYEVDEDATYVLRIQPELLRGGRYSVVERTLASLPFPVSGLTARNVASGFGAPRNGGGRVHDGIDIFAPRGTPVVAVTGGIARTDTNNLGGNVIWLQGGGRRYYYAHLDSWAITGSARVGAGDVLGYVGNTGNASTTAPHLHFGIYDGGAVDPQPFVQADDAVPSAPPTPSGLGALARVVPARTPLREGAGASAAVRRQLDRDSIVRVMGAAQGSLRVVLPDHSVGYMAAAAMAPGDDARRRQQLMSGAVLRESPAADAPVVALLAEDVQADVLGRFDGYDFVRMPGGERGWVEVATTNAPR